MSGGWTAKELAERGLKVLVLERGNEILPERDYTDQIPPWTFGLGALMENLARRGLL